jgi:iron(III) transport system permease protein
MLRTAMAQVSSELEESAVMAGANPQVVLRRILLPLVVPMLATVFVFTFMMALRDISATVMLATPGTRTLSVLLFEYTVAGSYETAAVIGLLMAGLASLVALVALRTMRKHSLSGI